MVLITHNLLLTCIVTTCRLLIVFENIFNPCHVRLNVGSFLNSKLRDQVIFMKYIIVKNKIIADDKNASLNYSECNRYFSLYEIFQKGLNIV